MDGPPRRVSCEEDVCWVCLEGSSDLSGSLEHPCVCPRGVHAKCLARWQLQSAGREEERYCRFCKLELPDWRDILTPKVPAAPPVMAIVYDGKVVRLQVKPGREGQLEFQRQVRRAFNLGDDVELDCVFDCRAPGTGEKIKLRGLESYSAAMHCAAVAAGERIAKQMAGLGTGSSSLVTGNSSGGSGSSGSSGSRVAAGGGLSSPSSGGGSSSSTSGGGGAAAATASRHRSHVEPQPSPRNTATPRISTPAAVPLVPAALPWAAGTPRTARTLPSAAATMASAASVNTSPSTPRTLSSPSVVESSDAAAACHVPGVLTPRYDRGTGEVCGGDSSTPRSRGHEPSRSGGRRNLLMGLVRGIGAMRRVL
ncbi:hypothetical protein Vretimale_18554 [Volvox reticuliferus]|uniref:RING-CH-type domain-containing protein n=1 Tax=Volvox reticuliferus TaxID=1737510 RepID=A0A8J4GY69_9CHLO|nr:hypothetical protein Vretifemale_19643 [Volvox reticuliferus]GIM15866.1 hypothetical protein Vretimale_18554 [Volvox reticuliferus]